MTGGRLIRAATAAVVVAVAAFAAVVSFSHIFDLGRAHGQSGTAARLLPLSVDGLILAASLVMLHEARGGRDVPALARWMLALGVGATVAANVLYGVPFGPLAAMLSAWPAVAFIGAVEMLMGLVRAGRSSMAAGTPGDAEDLPDDMPPPMPVQVYDRCTAKIGALPGERCWRPLPCAEHDGTGTPAGMPGADPLRIVFVPAALPGRVPAGREPGIGRIKALGMGQDKARQVQALYRPYLNGHREDVTG